MSDTSEKDITKQLLAVTTTTTVTGVSAWYIWQFIIGIPILQSLLAFTTTAAVILVQIIFVWWFVGWVIYQCRMFGVKYKQETQKLIELSNQNRLRSPSEY